MKKKSPGKNDLQEKGGLPGSGQGLTPKSFLLLSLIIICFVFIGISGVGGSAIFKGTQTSAAAPVQTPTPPAERDVPNVKPQTDNGDGKISPAAATQIAALEQEKESRTPAQKKINSRLLYTIKMARQERLANGVEALETGLKADDRGYLVVDMTARVTDNLLEKLKDLKAEIITSFPQYHSIRARVRLTAIESLAELEEVVFIRPQQEAVLNKKPATKQSNPLNRVPPGKSSPAVVKPKPGLSFQERSQRVREYLASSLPSNLIPATGSVESQGDVTHRANVARLVSGFNGGGVKIGVLSDGGTSIAASQATGDLPATVTVLPGQVGSGDEGTAMLELVYDVAPGAQLYFATAFSGPQQFAQNIKDLRTAGCDIIIDDVSYFYETPFQNGQAPAVVSDTAGGIIVQAVNDVTVGSQAGALYFSSAANSGNKNDGTSGVWEGDFVNGGVTTTPLPAGGSFHNFGGGATFDTLTTGGRPILKWSDPLGGSGNDYDLYSLNSAGTTVTATSNDIQSGTQDPLEDIGNRPTGERLVVVQKTGAANRFLHLNTNRGTLALSTAGVVYGHNAGANTISCAATPAGPAVFSVVIGPFPKPFSTATNAVEIFSSDGPRRIFYNADSTPITPGDVSATGGQLLQKPDITAADGVSTTLPPSTGLNPFFGTSAAAPHAGALAALLKSARPAATRTEIYNAMTSTAIDIEAPGVDRDSGAGIFMPLPALAALGVTGPAYIEAGIVVATEAPGDGNGKLDPGETANLTVQLNNLGLANATGVSATLSTSTPGVVITQATQTYSNLNAINGNATNSNPFKFTLASNFPCGATVNFTLTVLYTGGASGLQTIAFSVKTGGTSISTTLDTTAPATGAGYTAVTGTQTGRLARTGVKSNCGSVKLVPAVQDTAINRRYDAYTFTSSAAGCVTVTLSSPTSGSVLYSVAYNGSYNPTSIQANFLADPGTSINGDSIYSFDVTAGQTFTIVVHEVPVGGGIGANYNLKLDGPVAGVCSNSASAARSRIDFDADGKTDLSVFRSGTWFVQRSTAGFTGVQWGAAGDTLVPADYNGDNKTDFAVYRAGNFYALTSDTNTFVSVQWGIATDVPVAGDFVGDSKADFAVYRASNNTWYFLPNGGGAPVITSLAGTTGSFAPLALDYDGDGKSDGAQVNNGSWVIRRSSDGTLVNVTFGQAGDRYVPADYDGDNLDDLAIFRDGLWAARRTATGATLFVNFGAAGDVAVPGDYDGDGRDDQAVFRSGVWYLNRSTGGFQSTSFGAAGDVPVPSVLTR